MLKNLKMNTAKKCYWFIFDQDSLLLKKENNLYTVPECSTPPVPVSYTFKINGQPNALCMAAIPDIAGFKNDCFEYVSLRKAWELIDAELYKMAGRAAQLLYWDKHSCFCPVCGTATHQTTPISKICSSCNYELYPVISTAILALVRKEDKILLVQARNFRGSFHSLVAGFLEAGETLEECVAREVKEETGLTVNNITYFGNQPWPFPSGLMVGYFADYVDGDIILQDEELKAAAFYRKDELPELPGKLSLARKMIDWWISSTEN